MRISVRSTPAREGDAEPRTLLSDFIRHGAGLHGTHVGCEQESRRLHRPARRRARPLVPHAGRRRTAVARTANEGLAPPEELHPIQAAFQETHALQCGFCTPGFLMTTEAFLRERPHPTETEIREALAGNPAAARLQGHHRGSRASRGAPEASVGATPVRPRRGPLRDGALRRSLWKLTRLAEAQHCGRWPVVLVPSGRTVGSRKPSIPPVRGQTPDVAGAG